MQTTEHNSVLLLCYWKGNKITYILSLSLSLSPF